MSKLSKIFVLGAFDYKRNRVGGQTIKTCSVYNLLVDRYKGEVSKVDTLDMKRKPWIVISMLYHLITCKTLVILPSCNNFTFLFPFVYVLSLFFRYDIVLICVGGWQVEYFTGQGLFYPHKIQLCCSRRIKAFLPEIKKVNQDLIESFGFTNTEVFPNFRKFSFELSPSDKHDELRLVFMARITKKKGYPVIFQALRELKKQHLLIKMVFYGPIAEEDKEDFYSLVKTNEDMVTYQGSLGPDEIQSTLSNYDVMLLPTQYYTEGFPGSILDAYVAGIPVIVTEWKHSYEFVKDGKTGFVIPFDDETGSLVEKILLLYKDRELLYQMKNYAHEECMKYSEDSAWEILKKYI